MHFEVDWPHGKQIAGVKQPARCSDAVDGRRAADGAHVWPFGRHRHDAMNRSNEDVEDSQVTVFIAADQSDWHEKRTGDATIRPVANDQFAGEGFGRWCRAIGH